MNKDKRIRRALCHAAREVKDDLKHLKQSLKNFEAVPNRTAYIEGFIEYKKKEIKEEEEIIAELISLADKYKK